MTIEDDIEVQGDRDRIKRLLENLFRNAVEHGSTSSRTESDDGVERGDRRVTVRVGTLSEESGFYVTDDGPGIPVEDHETVLESGYTTSEDGSGFGLAIVAEIAAAHEWDVRLSESVDGGVRFEFIGT